MLQVIISDAFDHVPSPVLQVLEAPPPPTLEDLLANRLRYLDRKAVAERRLGDEADERDVFLVARMDGAVLAVDFILRSLERLAKVWPS